MTVRTVLVDLDGTLANIEHRLPILTDGLPHRWERFNSLLSLDKPTVVVEWVQALALYYDIVVVSARSSQFRAETEAWLQGCGVPYSDLLMRDAGDTRDDTEIKFMMLQWFRTEKVDIFFVIDDRPEVVEMWRGEGLKVYPVNQASWETIRYIPFDEG